MKIRREEKITYTIVIGPILDKMKLHNRRFIIQDCQGCDENREEERSCRCRDIT